MARGDILATLQDGDTAFTIPAGKRGFVVFNLAASASIRPNGTTNDTASASASLTLGTKVFTIKVVLDTPSTQSISPPTQSISHFGKAVANDGTAVSLSVATTAPTNGQVAAKALATIIEY